MSVRVASIGENSTFSQRFFANATASPALRRMSSWLERIWCSMCRALVPTKVWMRGLCDHCTASHARTMSCSWMRARPVILGPLTSEAMRLPDSKSPWEVMGNPASITSTFRRASWRAISTFSSTDKEMPGDCSPSRKVVSKISTRRMCLVLLRFKTCFERCDSGLVAAGPRPPSSRRPLRNLDGHRPVGVLFPLAARGLEVQVLQALGDGSYAPVPDGAVVNLDHGRYLEPRPREEDLVRGVELRAAHLALYDGHPELFACQLHDGLACYSLQDVRRDGRCDELALPDQKDVRRARLGDLAVLGEEDGVVVTRHVRLIDRERRVDVGARALGAGRNGVVRRTPPGRDTDLEARKLHVVAHGDREDGEFGLALQVHPHGLGGLVGQGTDVGVFARGVALQDLQRDVAEHVDGVGQLYTQQPAGPLEALAHLQDLLRPAPLAPVGPYTLEDAGAVVQGVRRRREADVADPHQLAAVIGPLGVRRRECFTTHRFSPPAEPAGVSIPSAASARSSCPTFSTCDPASLRRIARKLDPPAWFSSTQSLAHLPLWTSASIWRILSLAASSMIFGPAV